MNSGYPPRQTYRKASKEVRTETAIHYCDNFKLCAGLHNSASRRCRCTRLCALPCEPAVKG